MKNSTIVRNFILLGLTDQLQLEILLFLLLLGIYVLTLLGTMLIVIITLVAQQLHTPMYFLVRHLALVGIGYSTTIIPKTLANIATSQKSISIPGCFSQLFIYIALGTIAFFLLAAMAIDRYMAICNPLHYLTIMSNQTCTLLVIFSWLGGLFLISGPVLWLFRLPFCGPNIINHFFCDIGPLLKLACTDTTQLECIHFFIATLSLLGTLAINIVSYLKIIATILRIPSTTGRKKAFSTCASHITVVSITYGSCIFMYVKPKSTSNLDFGKIVAILNTILAPLLISFFYCLRNKQVQDALRTVFRQCVIFWKNSR